MCGGEDVFMALILYIGSCNTFMIDLNIFGLLAVRLLNYLIYITGLGTQAAYIWFYQSIFTFLKRLLHEILASFTYMAYLC